MLEVKNIKKSYKTASFSQIALNDVSLKFRKSEFVAILGTSGSGKTTFLNIVSGLDKYDSGDLIINGKSTKKFKEAEWDSYRNNSIGFIFQSYNLIPHISVIGNIEMGMTLSGKSAKARREKALEVLDKVGLKEHAYKKPNQLSGGQMQRIAIARALANDPDIIMADEPTGAIDSITSIQIMDLIKEIAENKLVIMVTHNDKLAYDYADRIIGFSDGKVISDSNPYISEEDKSNYKLKKTAMSFFTALKLSFNNIRTKMGRTFLTAFASSIGIIGIALILSLSNGFNIQIKNFEKDSLSSMPIMIAKQAMQMDEETMMKMHEDQHDNSNAYTNKQEVYSKNSVMSEMRHENILTKDYIDYIEKIDPKLVGGISYTRITSLNILGDVNGAIKSLNLSSDSFVSMPRNIADNSIAGVLEETYDLLYGRLPSEKEDLILIVDNKNRVDSRLLEALGYPIEEEKPIKFDEIIGKEFKLVLNDELYKNLGDYFTINSDLEKLYNNKNTITLKIVGIIRGKEEKKILVSSSSGLVYMESLVEYIIDKNKDSEIVEKQKEVSYNVLTGEKFPNDEVGNETKINLLAYLGDDSIPIMIDIYPKDFDSKEKITAYLDKYNEGKDKLDRVAYTDFGKTISSLSGNIMDGVTIVLIAFSAISLIVSTIMIAIITYISVLERTKEIGILRALGARRKDIRRVFNAETFIVGLTSGLLGIGIARLLIIPTNILLKNLTELDNVARINPTHALILITVSIILTIIGGLIPSNIAAKKDPVIALRTE